MIRERWKNRFFWLAAVFMGFCALNLLVAAAGLDRVKEDRFYQDVFSILTEILPEAKIPFANTNKLEEHVNGLGFRGPETTWKKPSGVRRLVSVGDSSTFGVFCNRDETYTALVGARMSRIGNWETLNCGIPGTNILQHRFLYELKLHRLGADIVMVYVVPNVREDLDAMRSVYDDLARERPGFLHRVQGVFQHIPVYRFLLLQIRGPVSSRVKNQVELIYSEHRDQASIQYLTRGFEQDLRQFRGRIIAGNAKPVWIWHINRKVVSDQAAIGASVEMLERNPLDKTFQPYFITMHDFATLNGDAFVNPYPLAVEEARKGAVLFADEVHPTPAGHAVISKAIMQVLAPMASSIGK